jgi:hypothetical protein
MSRQPVFKAYPKISIKIPTAIAALKHHETCEKLVWGVVNQNQSDYTFDFGVHVDVASGEILLATGL